MNPLPLGSVRRVGAALAFLVLASSFATSLSAAPVAGFVETWSGVTLHGWGGGSSYTNPGTGGAQGAGDGYLRLSNSFPGRLGSNSTAAAYAGDWRTAGIVAVRVKLMDDLADQALEIHFSIGRRTNFWQYNTGFSPPNGSWGEFTIDLTNTANFTQTTGVGTLEDALTNVEVVLLRHDRAPFALTPDAIQGDFGVDDFTLVGALTPAATLTWGRIKALYK